MIDLRTTSGTPRRPKMDRIFCIGCGHKFFGIQVKQSVRIGLECSRCHQPLGVVR